MNRILRSLTVALIAAPLLLGLAGCGGAASLASNSSSSSSSSNNNGGGATTTHSVSLSWAPSTSSVAGYMVFRSTKSGGPYKALTSSPITNTTYTDKTVQAKNTYYYVTAAVTSGGVQSAYSNQATAVVP